MSTTQSLAEEFITTFHNANAGITAAAFATLPVQKSGRRYKCSYDCLAELIPDFKRQCSVLDLACGDGFLLSMLATRKQSGLSLAGIDMSAGEIDAARTRLGNAASLCLARAQSLPLQSKSVDYVLCHLAIMLMDNVESVVTEVQRVLRVGGTFSAVVGTRPLSSRAFDTYIELLAQYPKRKGMDFNRLGDSRFTTVTGIEEMFSKLFTKLTIEEIEIKQRYTPSELWSWFDSMYDPHMLVKSHKSELQTRLLADIAPHCNSDGKIELKGLLRQITAISTLRN